MRIAALCLLLVAGCGLPGTDPTVDVVRSDSAGVELIVSHGPDRPLAADFEPLFVVGGGDEGLHTLFRVAEAGIGSGPSGELVVLDPGNFRVLVFDSVGTVLRSFGRAGDGPGEFRIPTSLFVDEAGRVHIFDPGRRAHTLHEIDGALLEERALPARFLGGLTRPHSGAFFYGAFGASRTEWELLAVMDDTVSLIQALAAPAPRDITYESCGVRISLPPIFSRPPAWDAGEGWVAVARSPEYDVSMGRGDNSKRRIRRPIEPRAPTHEDVIAFLGESQVLTIGGSRDCVISSAEVIEKRGVSERLPTIWDLRIAPGGGLWIQRFDPSGEAHPIDVFDPDGAYLGTLPAGFPWPGIFLSQESFAVVEADELGVQRVVVYRFRIQP
jgi:hypothetical protein